MSIDLAMFTTDPTVAQLAMQAGIDRVVVDWETAGKAARQSGYSTQINQDSPEHVKAFAEQGIPVLVRIDHRSQEQVARDIEVAVDCGAESIMFPMAESVVQVQRFVDTVAGRVRTVVQIETQKLVDEIDGLNQIGWDHAFIGLNDLMISRGAEWIWRPVLDGTVEEIYQALEGRNIGFGGVTVVGGGSPLPFTVLFAEMARLGCSMSFLRRSFIADVPDRNISAETKAVRALWDALIQRGPEAVQRDRAVLREMLNKLDPKNRRIDLAS